jgi:hypothetical protein
MKNSVFWDATRATRHNIPEDTILNINYFINEVDVYVNKDQTSKRYIDFVFIVAVIQEMKPNNFYIVMASCTVMAVQ